MILQYNDTLSSIDIEYILGLPQVIHEKQIIDLRTTGSTYFTIELTPSLKSSLENKLGLDLSNISSIPMRWIKGDTIPHIDIGGNSFDNTYLVYIKDSIGNLIVEGHTYPITQGTAYVFNEGLYHETINTGNEPRLLLGPMSEHALSVGVNTISGPGGSTIYVRQITSDLEYSTDQITWYNLYLSSLVVNTDTTLGVLTIEFTTDITIDSYYYYLVCGSSHIQFGTTYLKEDGSRPTIFLSGIDGYSGFIQNGYENYNGYSNIYIYNLNIQITNNSTLFPDSVGGWLCQSYFGLGANNNYIINCSCNLDGSTISNYCGGIVGSYAGQDGNLKILYCNTTNGYAGTGAGGIAGKGLGKQGNVEVTCCWSDISIDFDAGGIVGFEAGDGNGDESSLTITKCYTTGFINGGGIVGSNAGNNYGTVTISDCYTTGYIENGGGIISYNAGINNGTVYVLNCYTTGNYDAQDGAAGICGDSPITINISHCYTAGTSNFPSGYIIGNSTIVNNGSFLTDNYSESASSSTPSWNSSHADSVLTGTPSPIIGTTWVNSNTNEPYELLNMGYSPYSTTNIVATPSPSLKIQFSTTINVGQSTIGGVNNGISYEILYKSGGNPDTYSTITINSDSGIVSTSSSTIPDTYTLYIRNNGSYHITSMLLTVVSPPPPVTQPRSPSFRRLHQLCKHKRYCIRR